MEISLVPAGTSVYTPNFFSFADGPLTKDFKANFKREVPSTSGTYSRLTAR